MDKNIVIVVLVVVLLVLSGVQALQISSLKSDINNGNLNVNAPTGSSGAQPVRQQAAPTMVGGC